MRYLGIDHGLRRVGVAICDPSETIVSPLTSVQVEKGREERVFKVLGEIIAENRVEEIVVGLPLNMDGSEGEQAGLVRKFAERLGRESGRPVHLQDERLSSAAADEKLREMNLSRGKRKLGRDVLAACEILQVFLDQKKLDAEGR